MQYGDLQLVHAVQETSAHLGVGFLAFGGKAEIGGLFDLNDEDGRGIDVDDEENGKVGAAAVFGV